MILWNQLEGRGEFWSLGIRRLQIRKSSFYIEMMVVNEAENENFWVTFVHASTETRERQVQWKELKRMKVK